MRPAFYVAVSTYLRNPTTGGRGVAPGAPATRPRRAGPATAPSCNRAPPRRRFLNRAPGGPHPSRRRQRRAGGSRHGWSPTTRRPSQPSRAPSLPTCRRRQDGPRHATAPGGVPQVPAARRERRTARLSADSGSDPGAEQPVSAVAGRRGAAGRASGPAGRAGNARSDQSSTAAPASHGRRLPTSSTPPGTAPAPAASGRAGRPAPFFRLQEPHRSVGMWLGKYSERG